MALPLQYTPYWPTEPLLFKEWTRKTLQHDEIRSGWELWPSWRVLPELAPQVSEAITELVASGNYFNLCGYLLWSADVCEQSGAALDLPARDALYEKIRAKGWPLPKPASTSMFDFPRKTEFDQGTHSGQIHRHQLAALRNSTDQPQRSDATGQLPPSYKDTDAPVANRKSTYKRQQNALQKMRRRRLLREANVSAASDREVLKSRSHEGAPVLREVQELNVEEVVVEDQKSSQFPERPVHEGDPLTRNQRIHLEKEALIRAELEANFAATGKVLGLNDITRRLKCHKETARPIWQAFQANLLPTAYIGSCPQEKPAENKLSSSITLGKANELLVGAKYTKATSRSIDDAATLFFELRHTHQLLMVTCDVLSDSEEADLEVALNSDGIISGFANNVIQRFGAHPHSFAVWERMPKHEGKLHIHALFAFSSTDLFPTQKQIENIWQSLLPQKAITAPNGAMLRLCGNEVHLKPYTDFQDLDNKKTYFSKIAKKYSGKTKFRKHHSDGKMVAPEHWEFITPSLKHCAYSALNQSKIPVRGRDAATDLIQQVTETICPGDWKEVLNKYNDQNAVTGYTKIFPSSHLPAITQEIATFAQNALHGPTALPEEQARDFALIKVHPSGLVILSTYRLPLRTRRKKSALPATEPIKQGLKGYAHEGAPAVQLHISQKSALQGIPANE